MDLGSHLANLSLAQIASMLNTKQQEVLLASISVAATFIQQLQAEEQQFQRLQAEEQQFLQEEQQFLQEEQEQQQQHNHQQQQQQHNHQQQLQLIPSNNNSTSSNLNTSINNDHHQFTQDNDDSFMNEDDDMTPIKKFAEELKNRRKLIRLSQKGAAQSLRAFSGGREPCTDAIIYHFENLQMEPQKAIKLIPLLRDWLDWAEKHKVSGKPLPMMSAVAKVPRERKRKVILFNDKAKQYLENEFLSNNHPDRYQLDVISQTLNIPTRSIRKWFTNRRQRKRFAEKFAFPE